MTCATFLLEILKFFWISLKKFEKFWFLPTAAECMEAVVDGGVEDESSVTRVKTCNGKLYNINTWGHCPPYESYHGLKKILEWSWFYGVFEDSIFKKIAMEK